MNALQHPATSAGSRPVPVLAVTIAALALTACSGGSGTLDGQPATGQLSVSLMDAPVDDVTSIVVTITELRLKGQDDGQPPMHFPLDPALQVDLLTLEDPDDAVVLLDAITVPAGAYNWLEMVVDAEFDSSYSSYVTENGGGLHQLRVPSSSVRLVSGFTVTANGHTQFLIDWDTRRGLVNPPGLPGYLLRPAFRVIDLTEFGTLRGVVDTSLILDQDCTNDLTLDTGNAVYVYEGHGADLLDIRDEASDPIATIRVRQQGADYVYATLLSPGEYTVAFTCQASDDDPDAADDIAFFATAHDVTIVDGGEAIADFTP